MSESVINLTIGEATTINLQSLSDTTISVQALAVGPSGTGQGTILQDYAILGDVTTWSGAVVLDLGAANVVQAELVGDVTSVSFANWSPLGNEAKVVLYLQHTHVTPFDVDGWPPEVKWVGGVPPEFSGAQGTTDILVFSSVDGGTTVYGVHVGVAS